MFTSPIAREPSKDAWAEVTQLHDRRDFGTTQADSAAEHLTRGVCPSRPLSKVLVVVSKPWQGE